MSLYCSSLGTIIPRILGRGKRYADDYAFTLTHVVGAASVPGSCFNSLHYKAPHKYNLSSHISFVSKFDQTCSFPVMEEDQNNLGVLSEPHEYSKELDVAVRAVQMACSLCQRLQDNLIFKTSTRSSHQVHSKDDNSPVTVAGESLFPQLGSLVKLLFLLFHIVVCLCSEFIVGAKLMGLTQFVTWVYLDLCIVFYGLLQQLFSSNGFCSM